MDGVIAPPLRSVIKNQAIPSSEPTTKLPPAMHPEPDDVKQLLRKLA